MPTYMSVYMRAIHVFGADTKQKEENNTLKSAAHTFSRRPYQNESVPVIPNFAHLLRSEGKAQMVTGRERLTRNGKATPPPTSPKPSRRQRQARNSPLLVSTPQQAMLQDTATSQEVKENLYEEIDFTGGTGDSGIGSGGGERSAWISHLPDRLGSYVCMCALCSIAIIILWQVAKRRNGVLHTVAKEESG